jgi:hypothetical protein
MKTSFSHCKPARPNLKIFLQKKLFRQIIFLWLISISFISSAQTIWNTGSFTFSFTAPGQLDCMTAQTCLTRSTVLFNSVCENVSGFQGCGYTGPCNTMWAIGNIANWNTLTYNFLYTAMPCPGPTGWIGTPIVCHLLAENIYLQLTFTSWTPGTNGPFSYSRSTASILPVLISNFTGHKSGNAILLDWTSGSENNFSHYNIQRSANGTDFIPLGRVDSKSINGNSSTGHDYNYTDTYPGPGHNSYRLEQVDRDGHKFYSKVIDLFNNNSGSTTVILQNPATNQVNLSISSATISTAAVKLFDINGRIVKNITTHLEKGNNSLQVHLDNLTSGLYVIQVYEEARLSFSGKIIR